MARLVNNIVIDNSTMPLDINKLCIDGTTYSINENKIAELEKRIQVLENHIKTQKPLENKYIIVLGE